MEIRALVGDSAEACGAETSLVEAVQAMVAKDIGSLAVIDDGRLAGIFTERDVLRAAAEGVDFSGEHVSEWMTIEPDTVGPDLEIGEAADWLMATGYRHLPVMDDGRLLGIASIKDVMWALTAPS